VDLETNLPINVIPLLNGGAVVQVENRFVTNTTLEEMSPYTDEGMLSLFEEIGEFLGVMLKRFEE